MSLHNEIGVVIDLTTTKCDLALACAKGKFSGMVLDNWDLTIGGYPNGTAEGNQAVAIMVMQSDGVPVYIETTLKLLLTACDALKAYYGDPR